MPLAGEWSIWSWACVRAAGFPADRVSALSAPTATAAIGELSAITDRVDAARACAVEALERAPASKPVHRALKAARRGEAPAPFEGLDAGAARALDELQRVEAMRAEVRAAAQRALEADGRAIAQALVELAGERRFREALLWQNRVAAHGSVAALRRRPVDAIDSKTREQRRLVASYLQRYCVKNDTIGFFGPVGWARVSDRPGAVTVHAGPDLLAKRTVYFEYWAIDALAQQLARDPELRPYLKPRRMPSVWIEGGVLHHPNGKRFELPPQVASLLAAIDGTSTAHELARRLAEEVGPEADVLALLDELAQRKLCSWTLEIPTATFEPEHHLRAALEDAAGPARDRALQALDQLEARRAAVARAAGDPDALDGALHALESTFEQLAATGATRRGGETYAGRMVVFEDCRRDLRVELGQALVQRLGPPLALVLDSARWYTHEIAVRYGAALRELHDQLRRELGSGTIDYVRFHDRLPALFPGPSSDHGIVGDVTRELHARWGSILAVGEDPARVIARRSAELGAAVAAAFQAPAPGWPGARHHSPDVMIAASGVDAIDRGDYHFVLGELHVGLDTVMPCLRKEHPEPELLVRARELDLPEPGIEPVWSKQRNRADFFSVSRHDLDLERGETRSARPRAQVLTTGELVVEARERGLVVRTRDGRCSFPILAFLERQLIAESYARFSVLAPRPHSPRVVIDDLVVQRESWRFDAAELGFATQATELDRQLAVRRFAERHGMPRRVYAKTDAEAKPFFVDLESPILVDLLARSVRRARRLVLSEMSPGLDQCWLSDAHGQRYTSELRLVATDLRAWAPGR